MWVNGIEFDWDAVNLSHIAEHGLTPEEAVQVLENNPVDLDYQVVEGEERWVDDRRHNSRAIPGARLDHPGIGNSGCHRF